MSNQRDTSALVDLVSRACQERGQHQGSLQAQMRELAQIASRHVLYDAADYAAQRLETWRSASESMLEDSGSCACRQRLGHEGSLVTQLSELIGIANLHGLYDAADYVVQRLGVWRFR